MNCRKWRGELLIDCWIKMEVIVLLFLRLRVAWHAQWADLRQPEDDSEWRLFTPAGQPGYVPVRWTLGFIGIFSSDGRFEAVQVARLAERMRFKKPKNQICTIPWFLGNWCATFLIKLTHISIKLEQMELVRIVIIDFNSRYKSIPSSNTKC